jgi:collagenase-like PrtC family protease
MEFPVLCDNMTCRITILNSFRLFVPEVLQKLADCGVDAFRLYILDEEEDEIKNLIKLYRNYIEYGKAADARMDEEAARIKAAGFTKGHYFRGV